MSGVPPSVDLELTRSLPGTSGSAAKRGGDAGHDEPATHVVGAAVAAGLPGPARAVGSGGLAVGRPGLLRAVPAAFLDAAGSSVDPDRDLPADDVPQDSVPAGV